MRIVSLGTRVSRFETMASLFVQHHLFVECCLGCLCDYFFKPKKGGEKEENSKKTRKGSGKGAATTSHLEKNYRPGNANYRIQKVCLHQHLGSVLSLYPCRRGVQMVLGNVVLTGSGCTHIIVGYVCCSATSCDAIFTATSRAQLMLP